MLRRKIFIETKKRPRLTKELATIDYFTTSGLYFMELTIVYVYKMIIIMVKLPLHDED